MLILKFFSILAPLEKWVSGIEFLMLFPSFSYYLVNFEHHLAMAIPQKMLLVVGPNEQSQARLNSS